MDVTWRITQLIKEIFPTNYPVSNHIKVTSSGDFYTVHYKGKPVMQIEDFNEVLQAVMTLNRGDK